MRTKKRSLPKRRSPMAAALSNGLFQPKKNQKGPECLYQKGKAQNRYTRRVNGKGKIE